MFIFTGKSIFKDLLLSISVWTTGEKYQKVSFKLVTFNFWELGCAVSVPIAQGKSSCRSEALVISKQWIAHLWEGMCLGYLSSCYCCLGWGGSCCLFPLTNKKDYAWGWKRKKDVPAFCLPILAFAVSVVQVTQGEAVWPSQRIPYTFSCWGNIHKPSLNKESFPAIY